MDNENIGFNFPDDYNPSVESITKNEFYQSLNEYFKNISFEPLYKDTDSVV